MFDYFRSMKTKKYVYLLFMSNFFFFFIVCKYVQLYHNENVHKHLHLTCERAYEYF